jgi:hypothetical protein
MSEEIARPDGRAQPKKASSLRSKLLATAGAASAHQFAATDGGLACEETVATGAHEIAGLKSPLHFVL